MIRNTVLFNQGNEMTGCVTRQRRATEMRILRQEIFGFGMTVGEVATATTRDANFFAKLVIMVDQQDLLASLSGLRRTHHAGGTGTDDDYIEYEFQAEAANFAAL